MSCWKVEIENYCKFVTDELLTYIFCSSLINLVVYKGMAIWTGTLILGGFRVYSIAS